MTVQLYDTRAQALREFVPGDPGNVTIYVCGPTVQSGPHIGHLRGALSFDILRRWLAHRFGRVTFVRNVTDIDDKVLANASHDEPWWALAYRMELEFTRAYSAIGILPPTYEPRATASIPQMQELIERLIASGHAYAAAADSDAAGDVYFDVRSWPAYGSLTNQSLDAMEPAADADPRGKRDPRDFALWKGAKSGEPESATWDSPWGPGRPGWHIECSAMSRRYLGPEFDIHGGGLDLRFPHHENELAQSTAAGDPFARYWVHNGLVTVNGQKMSKSLFNFILASDAIEQLDPLVLRYALAAAHYRSSLDVSQRAFDEAAAAVDRIRTFLERVRRIPSPFIWSAERPEGYDPGEFDGDEGALDDDEYDFGPEASDDSDEATLPGDEGPDRSGLPLIYIEDLPEAFVSAMDDDLGVPQALAVIHEAVRNGNTALDAGDAATAWQVSWQVHAMTRVLGIDPLDEQWSNADASGEASALDTLVQTMIAQRADARAAKDWATADRIRDAIAAAGIALEDGPDGTHWSLAGADSGSKEN